MIFGRGTKLSIDSREESLPSYYRLSSNDASGDISACLASDFSNHKALTDNALFNKIEADRMTGDPFYSQVALYEDGQEDKCNEDPKDVQCTVDFEPDAKVNLLTLTTLGLRLLFLKTIVFNVLMTLRLWIS
ncbi:M1-specific T cell receptor alpha chain-like [Centroberyx gerrardi]